MTKRHAGLFCPWLFVRLELRLLFLRASGECLFSSHHASPALHNHTIIEGRDASLPSTLRICFLLNPSPQKFILFLIIFFSPKISHWQQNCGFSLRAHGTVTDASKSHSVQLVFFYSKKLLASHKAIQFESCLWTRTRSSRRPGTCSSPKCPGARSQPHFDTSPQWPNVLFASSCWWRQAENSQNTLSISVHVTWWERMITFTISTLGVIPLFHLYE